MTGQEKTQYKFLDLSGYMFSGKAAVIDLMREFDGYFVPHYRHEFVLIRVQDGIMDLEKALIDDWSPIRSDAAIQRFLKLVTKLSGSHKRLFSLKEEELVRGWNYDKLFKGLFSEYSMEYANALVDLKIRAYWPYHSLNETFYEILQTRLIQLFRVVFRSLKGKRRNTETVATETDLFLVGGDNFYDLTNRYLQQLLSVPVEDPRVHTIVMHNAFEPFNPGRAIKYFKDARCIVVDRDPRDIYVTSLTHSDGYNDFPDIYKKTSCAFDVNYFIKRFKILRRKTNAALDPEGRVLRLRFEQLVYDYDRTLDLIYQFLGENERTHIRKLEFYKPSVSEKNIGLWKSYPRQEEIELIASELREFCWN